MQDLQEPVQNSRRFDIKKGHASFNKLQYVDRRPQVLENCARDDMQFERSAYWHMPLTRLLLFWLNLSYRDVPGAVAS